MPLKMFTNSDWRIVSKDGHTTVFWKDNDVTAFIRDVKWEHRAGSDPVAEISVLAVFVDATVTIGEQVTGTGGEVIGYVPSAG